MSNIADGWPDSYQDHEVAETEWRWRNGLYVRTAKEEKAKVPQRAKKYRRSWLERQALKMQKQIEWNRQQHLAAQTKEGE